MAIRSAVIGGGIAGQIHVDILDLHPKVDLVGICDRDPEVLREISTNNPVERYTDVETMIAEERLDSVHVCTPAQTHVPIATEVLAEGIPTLIEKPVATTIEEVETLMECSEEHDTVASVVHNKKFTPYMLEALESFENGEIGDVVSATMLFSEPQDLYEPPRGEWVFDLPGGEIGEGVAHQAYLPLSFVDGLGSVSCVTKQNFRDYDDPIDFDGATIEATDTTGDRLLTIKILTNAVPKNTLEVHGTEGELIVDFRRFGAFRNRNRSFEPSPLTLFLENVDMATQMYANIVEKAITYQRLMRRRFRGDVRGWANTGHFQQIDRHVEALERGVQPPVTLQEGYDTVRILEALA